MKKPGEEIKYRPICLLNEVAKVFKRIITFRINKYMVENQHAHLSDHQYGFRAGRSTINALLAVKKILDTASTEKQYVIALALDIKNAFNSLPWNTIILELKRKRFPKYITDIIASYLNKRKICYIGCDNNMHMRNMTAGVPQGSVLGPLLWNIAYNRVLETAEKKLPEDCHLICYADDTILLTKGITPKNVISKANFCAARIIRDIESLGLKVAPEKTEAILFCRKPNEIGPLVVSIGDRDIPVNDSLKYLGIILDGSCSFKNHFRYIEEKASGIIRALWKIMPNLRGPDETKRKLYSHVIHSVLLYGAPVWGERLAAFKSLQAPIRRLQKSIAIRVVRGYKTLAYNAVTLLARIPPFYLMASKYRRIYKRCRSLADRGELTIARKKEIRDSSEILLRRQWRAHLTNPNLPGARVRSYILPVFDKCLDRSHGCLSHHLTQLITGHGSFGVFLARIGKYPSALCLYCREEDETSQHVLSMCPRWESERETLREFLGEDLRLEVVIETIINDVRKWKAICSFAKTVLEIKEHDDWIRQKSAREADYYGISTDSENLS